MRNDERAEGDLALVERVIAGDEAAYRTFRARIDRIVEKCLRDVSARCPWVRAEEPDLLQRFAAMLLEDERKTLRSFQGRSSLSTWIHVIASRFFQRRANVTRPRGRHEAIEDVELADPGDSPELAYAKRVELGRLKTEVDRLDPDDRLMLALIYEQDLPAHAIGEVLSLTASGVRMRKQRLLEKLSKRLAEVTPGERDATNLTKGAEDER
jgi:RNA polymerase sigma-70 factor (ECF subfamily)